MVAANNTSSFSPAVVSLFIELGSLSSPTAVLAVCGLAEMGASSVPSRSHNGATILWTMSLMYARRIAEAEAASVDSRPSAEGGALKSPLLFSIVEADVENDVDDFDAKKELGVEKRAGHTRLQIIAGTIVDEVTLSFAESVQEESLSGGHTNSFRSLPPISKYLTIIVAAVGSLSELAIDVAIDVGEPSPQ